MKLLAACLLLALSPLRLQAQDLAAASRALGDSFEGIWSVAACTGPNGDFRSETISMASGTVRFVQTREGESTAWLVHDEFVHVREGDGAAWAVASARMEDFVRGHEVHRMLLELEDWFEASEMDTKNGCLALVQRNGLRASLCLDESTGRPATLTLDLDAAVGGGTIRMDFADWRRVHGTWLPFEVTFDHEGSLYRHRFTTILPFRISPGARWPDEAEAVFERLGDAAALVAAHDRALRAHRASDVELLVADEAPRAIVSGRGRLTERTVQATRERLGPYLRSTSFERYEDTAVPAVALALDGSLGWLACEVEAEGIQRSGDDDAPVLFGFSWVELYAKFEGIWWRVGNASSSRPEP